MILCNDKYLLFFQDCLTISNFAINLTKMEKTTFTFLCSCKSSLTVTSSRIAWNFMSHEMYERMWDCTGNLKGVERWWSYNCDNDCGIWFYLFMFLICLHERIKIPFSKVINKIKPPCLMTSYHVIIALCWDFCNNDRQHSVKKNCSMILRLNFKYKYIFMEVILQRNCWMQTWC